MTPVAVFDCVTLLQALARPNGPAAACLRLVVAGACELVVSDDGVDELRDAVNRPGLRGSFIRASDQEVVDYLILVATLGRRVDPVPAVITLARDPKDEKYLNLAVAAGASYVVTRDNDMPALMTGTDADAVAFRTHHPAIEILTPPAFLARLAPPTP